MFAAAENEPADIKASRGANWKRISVLKLKNISLGDDCCWALCCVSAWDANKEIISHYFDQLRIESE